MFKIIIHTCFFLFFCACHNSDNIQKQFKDAVEVTNNQYFSNQDLEKLAKCSGENINILIQNSDTLIIGSGGKLIYMPFGISDSLLIRNHAPFTYKKYSETDNYGHKREIIRLSYKKSFIKYIILNDNDFPQDANELAEYRYKKPNKIWLISSRITDPEIELIYKIKIGMSKIDFFKVIFPQCTLKMLYSINVVENEDTLGEHLKQYFIFQNDKLIMVTMQTQYPSVSTEL